MLERFTWIQTGLFIKLKFWMRAVNKSIHPSSLEDTCSALGNDFNNCIQTFMLQLAHWILVPVELLQLLTVMWKFPSFFVGGIEKKYIYMYIADSLKLTIDRQVKVKRAGFGLRLWNHLGCALESGRCIDFINVAPSPLFKNHIYHLEIGIIANCNAFISGVYYSI